MVNVLVGKEITREICLMNYDTALRMYTAKRIEEIETADILVGIPCYNNDSTITHVIQMVSHGLAKHYKNKRSVIHIADGGSTDDTREMAKEFQIKPWQEKIVSISQWKRYHHHLRRSRHSSHPRGAFRIRRRDRRHTPGGCGNRSIQA